MLSVLLTLSSVAQAQFLFTTNNGTITITGYTGSDNVVSIPGTTNGLFVTSIGNNAFENTTVASVTIPDSITNIGSLAFWDCSSLTNVALGNGILSIGDQAFYFCTTLPTISIPNTLTHIGDSAFACCYDLTSAAIPGSVTSIGDGAFEHCSGITNATIPSGATNIGPEAFAFCSNLTAISVDTNNPAYVSVGGVLFDRGQTTLIQYPAGNAAHSYAISDSVTNIATSAFAGCAGLTNVTIGSRVASVGTNALAWTGLTSITIPNGVVSIGDSALAYCFDLAVARIPSSVMSLGEDVFYYCKSLASIDVDPGNPAYISIGGVLFNHDQSTLIQYPVASTTNSYAIPNTVINIDDYAFWMCYGLTNVTIGSSVANMGDGAFCYCGGLSSITLPESVISLGSQVFMGCTNVSSLDLGTTLPSIGQWAFYGCSGLSDVTIPDTVTNMGALAFCGCSRLTNVVFGKGLNTVPPSAFSGCGFQRLTIPATITSIGSSAFANCAQLTLVMVASSVTNLAHDSFSPCHNLTAVFFEGDAPDEQFAFGVTSSTTKAYYLPGTSGWGAHYDSLAAVLWNPRLHIGGIGSGGSGNGVSLNVTGTAYIPIVLEARTNMSSGPWTMLQNCILTNGTLSLSDLEWTNYANRFYRVRSP